MDDKPTGGMRTGDGVLYRGPDRRHAEERRQGHDRREMIRFEPDKDDRRSGKDRRLQDGWGKQQSRY